MSGFFGRHKAAKPLHPLIGVHGQTVYVHTHRSPTVSEQLRGIYKGTSAVIVFRTLTMFFSFCFISST